MFTTMKKLFLDDVRTVDMVYAAEKVTDFVVVRSYQAFVTHIQAHGLPPFISFDNDLGLDADGNIAPDGYAAEIGRASCRERVYVLV